MKNPRRRSREAAIQALYAMDMGKADRHETTTRLGAIVDDNVYPQDDFSFRLLTLAEQHAADIEDAIDRALKGWTKDRLSAPDRAMIRLGAVEILYCDDIPPRVSINEYIELAKSYGDSESPRFINGVLDRILRDSQRATA